jgi:hypothetical protein
MAVKIWLAKPYFRLPFTVRFAFRPLAAATFASFVVSRRYSRRRMP